MITVIDVPFNTQQLENRFRIALAVGYNLDMRPFRTCSMRKRVPLMPKCVFGTRSIYTMTGKLISIPQKVLFFSMSSDMRLASAKTSSALSL